MMDHGYGMGAGWLLLVLAVMLTGLVFAAVLIPLQGRRHPAGPVAGVESLGEAEQILADRFARGEIDAEEYEQRLHTLRAGRR